MKIENDFKCLLFFSKLTPQFFRSAETPIEPSQGYLYFLHVSVTFSRVSLLSLLSSEQPTPTGPWVLRWQGSPRQMPESSLVAFARNGAPGRKAGVSGGWPYSAPLSLAIACLSVARGEQSLFAVSTLSPSVNRFCSPPFTHILDLETSVLALHLSHILFDGSHCQGHNSKLTDGLPDPGIHLWEIPETSQAT